uniref:Uncharacterized protein n=1 Tax=Anguilla anguilla TaxID=7936 RepID=A0A0E9VS43_ANGAN
MEDYSQETLPSDSAPCSPGGLLTGHTSGSFPGGYLFIEERRAFVSAL